MRSLALIRLVGAMFLFICSVSVCAQQIKLLHYGIEEGLPSNIVYRVYRDSKGFLWFATDKGVSRFNGQQFTNYNTSDGLPDNEVFFFAEDKQARIWMGTFNGQLCYFEKEQFYTAKNKPFLKLPFQMTINSFHLAEDGSITMLFNKRRFIDIRDTVTRLFDVPGSAEMVWKNREKEYELLNADRRTILDTAGRFKRTVPFRKNTKYTIASSGAENGNVYLIGQVGIYDLDEHLLFDIKEPIHNSYYIPYILVKDRNYFLCSHSGLYTSNGIVLKGIPVSGIAADNNGNYWISTLGKGIYCLNKNIHSIKEYAGVYESLVSRAASFRGSLQFINREGKLYSLDKKSGTPNHQLAEAGHDPHLSTSDSGGNYLFFYYRTKTITDNKGNARKIPWDIVLKDVLLDQDDIYLLTPDYISRISYSGLLRRRRANVLQRYVSGLGESRNYTFAIDRRSGVLWYSTAEALYKTNRYDSLPQKRLPGFSFRNFGFYEDYLIGYTDRNELIICNHYDSDHPFTDTIKGDNGVWEQLCAVTANQLIISGTNNYHLLTLKPSNGKPEFSFRTIENPFVPAHAEYICSDSNSLYFFRNGNITAVDKAFLLRSVTPAPSVSFSGIKTKHRYHGADSTLTLSYAESRSISINFRAISFYGKVLEYEYCIKGHMDHWEPVHTGEINIASLPYGRYSIEVRCKSLSSSYSSKAKLQLIITRPYWATWWFIAGMIFAALLILLLLVGLVSRIMIKRKQKEYQINLKYQQLEFKSLNALMNPHFIFNSLNNIQGLINDNNKYAANKYLGIFSNMIRQNMQNIAREHITLKQELDLILNYLKLEKLRFEHSLDYRLEIEKGVDTEKILIPALLIQPLVENAVKHGFPYKRSYTDLVSIRVYRDASFVHIEIKDNGVGLEEQLRSKPVDHSSYGLDNIRARIQHMQQIGKRTVLFDIVTLKGERGNISGTRACISIGEVIYHS